MYIGKHQTLFERIPDMVFMEEVYNEIRLGKDKFLHDFRQKHYSVVKEYDIMVDSESLEKQINIFLAEGNFLPNKQLATIKKDIRLALKSQIGSGDLDILAQCEDNLKSGDDTIIVVTHDAELHFLLMNKSHKTLFLLEFIIENFDKFSDFDIGILDYLNHYCLSKYPLDLKQLRTTFGDAASSVYLRKFKINQFMKNLRPHRGKVIIPT
jgi:hypothetical protein